MFIKNKVSGVISECSNNDVIKACKKDEKNFAVAETKEELMESEQKAMEPDLGNENSEGEEDIHEDEKADTEASEEGENESEEDAEEESEDYPLNGAGDESMEALNKKTVADLGKIAKDKGIQRYSNMSKDTLIAMIMNH